MSEKTFIMSPDQTGSTLSVPHRGLQIMDLSPDKHYSSSSLSLSADSDSSVAYISDQDMLECCINEGPCVDNSYNTSVQGHVLGGVRANMNQTFIASPINGSIDLWNKNLSVVTNQETSLEMHSTVSENNVGENSPVASLDSTGRESHLSSCETSRRGSTENDHCSISSGEILMRTSSCLEDQSLLVVSSLEDSSLSLAASHPALLHDSYLLSTTLPDICEKSTERPPEENMNKSGHVGLGITFVLGDNCGENDIATCNYHVTLPSENEGALMMTFLCETSTEDGQNKDQFGGAEAELLAHFPAAITPEQGKTCVTTLSAMQDTNKDIHTSTPIQNCDNEVPNLPSFSESPCIGNATSPRLQPGQQQSLPKTAKQDLPAAAMPRLVTKVKTMENKKSGPKSNFSNFKSKVTKAIHQIALPGLASQNKSYQGHSTSKRTEAQRATTIRISPTKVKGSTAGVSTASKLVNNTKKQLNPLHHHIAAGKHAAEAKQVNSFQEPDPSVQVASNQTFCFLPIVESPDKPGLKLESKQGMLNKLEVRSGSAVGQDKPHIHKTLPRCSSESSSSTRPSKDRRITLRFSNSFTNPKADRHLGRNKSGNLTSSSQNKQNTQAETTKELAENSARAVKKISLLVETEAEAPCEGSKSRFRIQPSPRQNRGPPPASSPRAAILSTRQKHTTPGKNEYRSSKTAWTPQPKEKGIAGDQRRDSSLGTLSKACVKPKLNGSHTSQIPTRPSLMGPPSTPVSRTHKTLGPSKILAETSFPVSGGAACKTPLKSVVLKARLTPTSGRNAGQLLTTACKPATPASKRASNSVTPLNRTPSARLTRVSSGGCVDKSKPKGVSHQQQQPSHLNRSPGPPDAVPTGVVKSEKKDQSVQQLRGRLAASNRRFEALAIVLQQTLIERDDTTRHCRDLSQELVNLRGDLVCSLHSSEQLEKEKQELRSSLENALQRVKKQHQKDVAEMEQRLQAFYQAECDKFHLAYQEEADKCQTIMQQQVGELKASHEAMKLELQNSHAEQLQSVKQHHETELEEHMKVHQLELQSLKDAETSLLEQIQELTAENNALMEKLTVEENRRKELAEKNQKDSHTLYLEQELESLKVVLEIKNKQLHQQEKKLMEIDKLTEKNVKLDDNLKKVQQENEDLKARMERHAALSRQLSTEQAVLQESLQKESKVNKRLSMENEELLWKLHNGDLSSPRMASPTTPTFSLQTPRSAAVFSSPPLSPR